MKISFDLDGVIADNSLYFFGIVEEIRRIDPKKADLVELAYYNKCSLKFHPNEFLSPDDEGFIVTLRKPNARKITRHWLRKHGIGHKIIFVNKTGDIDWQCYQKASEKAAKLKADVIKENGIEVHFDNNPIVVQVLRKLLPDLRVIQVGGQMVIC